MAATCPQGHPLTPDNIARTGDRERCLACKRVSNVISSRKYHAKRLHPAQLALLRRAALDGVPALMGNLPDPGTLRAMLRRGLIYRSAGYYRLTEAGEQALAAQSVAAP